MCVSFCVYHNDCFLLFYHILLAYFFLTTGAGWIFSDNFISEYFPINY